MIYVVAGPTASGKSSYAIKLAKDINGYIINADSRQVYKELTIGTAKPTPDTINENGTWVINKIEHYLYGHVSIKEPYNLYKYQKDVEAILEKKKDSKQIPILVGGTGLYIDAVIYNYKLKESENLSMRAELSQLSLEQLQEKAGDMLEELNKSDRQNPIRIIRLIERGGKYKQGKKRKHQYIVLDIEKEKLDDRIEKRVDEMFKEGLEEENHNLLEQGYTYNTSAMRTLGYQEFEEYFKGNKTLEEVRKEIILKTKQYAKRQRTWFRKRG